MQLLRRRLCSNCGAICRWISAVSTGAAPLEFHFYKSSEKFKPDDKHAWWVFKGLQDKVRADYEDRIRIVRAVWDKFEATVFAEQPAFEDRVLEMYQHNKLAARHYLTDYSGKVALRAAQRARELTERLK